MSGEKTINLPKQYRKLSYPSFPILRMYNNNHAKNYERNTDYSILVNGTKMLDVKLVAVNITPMKHLCDELTKLDCDLTKKEFIDKYSKKYSVDALIAVMFFVRR